MRVGCDIVDLARFQATLARRSGMRDRLFTAVEQEDARRGGVTAGSDVELERLAARFAAKEAARKALGDLRLGFHATEVRREPDGSPRLWIDGAPSDLSVSMSHDGGVAMAVVVGPPSAPDDPAPSSPDT
jgi:holo-[acyl-carrier protein] synthase